MHNPTFSLTVIVAATLSISFIVLKFDQSLHLFGLHASTFTQICTNDHLHFHIYSFSCFPSTYMGFLSSDLSLLGMHYAFLDLKALPWLQDLHRGYKGLAPTTHYTVLGANREALAIGIVQYIVLVNTI